MTTTTSRQRATDQLLELAVLAQLHMWAIESQANDEPEDNLPLWQMQRDANVMAMLMIDGMPTAQQIRDGITRVQEVARLALDEVSTPARTVAATGYLLPEHQQEPPVLEYMAAIRHQERAVDPWAQVAVEQAKAQPLTMPPTKPAYVRLQWREAGRVCTACQDREAAQRHWPAWGCERSPIGQPVVFHCDCPTCQP